MPQEVKQHPAADKAEPEQRQYGKELTTKCEAIGILAVERKEISINKKRNKLFPICEQAKVLQRYTRPR